MSARGPVGSIALLVIRLLLAGVFALAAWEKLKPADPANPLQVPPTQEFAQAIIKLQAIPAGESFLAPYFAYVVPWTEAVLAVALVLGLWTRAAAFVTAAMYAYFTWLIVAAIGRGTDFDCYCLGSLMRGWNPWAHVAIDAVAFVFALILLIGGGGNVAADRLAGGSPRKRAEADE